MKTTQTLLLTTLVLGFMTACGGSETESSASGNRTTAPAAEFTDFELEHGIGPITSVIELGPIMQDRVERGRNIYEMKCEMCHTMDTRMVGPALGDVMDRRSATFVMNMILNPNEMAQKHPEGKKLLQEYMTVMPYQNVAEDEARDIVEYLRTEAPSYNGN